MSSLSAEIVVEAESSPDIQAGIARLEEVLESPSYQVVPEGDFSSGISDAVTATRWPPETRSVLVLGLHHPESDPRLDWWEGGGSPGDRRLVQLSEALQSWLKNRHRIRALLLPYHEERGGLFLKDAAVLAGLGIVGSNNLLVNPDWGPRIRFRALLVEEDLEPTGPVEGFAPCESCAQLCHLACPRDVFHSGAYHRPTCIERINADVASKVPDECTYEWGAPRLVTKYCRACELACPVGL